ncbi:hypothetical protein [Paraclostridium bifermentans]|uniref:Uncharacterized protein n=1 Tax=Paraclostridium bifermentans ATCC 638 = DSM 14991 TaxID=1233171 RepID=T4VGQ4_PARBF|nr:hypothetical protein [Paraclostridium bifermentans]EQK42899.1 hypothetical protein C672_1843 [[Clostridium] bifermentans ATCC 638] [Paraclostridium bifermentans ATCC 638 = DSM 14991]RIZ58030.1 hypothetical protein CHH45_13355 [Paraclostridium bifermentans]TQO55617.1 hypothetical protein D5S05_17175 [Paraclostridium bifermentans]UAG16783.1 hypothetical protein KXZ80_08255 [Paraclostridium bifermentans]
MDESTLLGLLSEINMKLDLLPEIDKKVDTIQNSKNEDLTEIKNLHFKFNNIENRIIKNDNPEQILKSLDEIKLGIGALQVKLRQSLDQN